MKKQLALAAVAGLLSAAAALAQGTVNFNNFVSGSINAPVRDNTGALVSGAAGLAQLWAGPNAASLAPIGAIVPFRTGGFAGYVNVGSAGARTIGTVAPGNSAVIEVRAWLAASGADWAAASSNPTGVYGMSPQLSVTTGGVPDPTTGIPSLPANLVGLQGFSLVPEPSTIALGLLGAAALLIRRRK